MKQKNKSSIIITAENKENTIFHTVKSCLNQDYRNIEIFIVYSNLKNEKILKNRLKSKKVFFVKVKKSKNNIHDQIQKIKIVLPRTRGRIIFLLDGDDSFDKIKIKTINNLIYKINKLMILDNHLVFNDEKNSFNINTKFEMNYIYKLLINPWPKKICTSSISINKKLLMNFFKEIKYKKFNHLAIDALLVLYSYQKNLLAFENKILTNKRDEKNSVDKKYSGFFNLNYWERRFEQHKFFQSLNEKFYLNLDYIVTLLFYYPAKILSKILLIFK
jgi:hypothetical protein